MVIHKLTIYTNISIHRSEATRLVGNGSNVHVVLFISDKLVLISVAVTGQHFKNFTLIGSRIVGGYWPALGLVKQSDFGADINNELSCRKHDISVR